MSGPINTGGLQSVSHDATLAGSGTSGSQLGVIGVPNGSVGNAGLATAPATTVKGNPTNATAAVQDFAASADGQVIGRSGGTLAWSIHNMGMFGNGSDGSPTFDGTTTILGMAPSTSVYTLTRDLYLDSPTINSSVTLKTNGFRVFIKTNLIGPASGTATIADVASNGVSGSGTTPGPTTTGRAATFYDSNINGGSGGTSGVAGTGGTSHNTASPAYLPGAGGAGGNASGGSSGGGGGAQPTASILLGGGINNIVQAMGGQMTGGNTTRFRGGAGGGGGGAASGGSGGAGGAGGGYTFVAALTVTNPAHVLIHANGGNGGNGGGTNGSGGGGGGGGYCTLVQGYGTNPTVQAAGGTHGTATGTGAIGVDGNVGQTQIFNLSGL